MLLKPYFKHSYLLIVNRNIVFEKPHGGKSIKYVCIVVFLDPLSDMATRFEDQQSTLPDYVDHRGCFNLVLTIKTTSTRVITQNASDLHH